MSAPKDDPAKSAKAPVRIIAGAIGSATTGLFGLAGYWLGGISGMVLPFIGALISACLGATFLVVNDRYLRILGHSGLKNDRALPEYEALRTRLAAGGNFAQIYSKKLTDFLNRVERFFGDAGDPRRIWAHDLWGGLRETPALWTAPAYDRCLLLALIYPIAVIYFVWAIGNHIGPAEAALGLRENAPDWVRIALPIVLTVMPIAAWKLAKSSGRATMYWGIVFLVAVAVAVAGAVAFFFLIQYLNDHAIRRGWQASFLAALTFLLALVCLMVPYWLAAFPTWTETGPLILFLGLLPLINAVFDWLSLGFTRLLLHLGLQWQRWWPVFFALIDAACAVIFIYGLAFTMILGVQTFDAVAIHAGGRPILPLDEFFTGLRNTPAAYEYWWVHALLITTLLPSAINLAIGGFSLLRGIPGLNDWMLARMPAGRSVAPFDRVIVALVLTLQIFGGIAAGIIAQAAIAAATIFWLVPAFGFNLLDKAQSLATANLPARLFF